MYTREESKRELGVIKTVQSGKEDHGILTCWLFIDFSSSIQGFGGLALDELLDDYQRQLCETFGVRKFEQLEGQKCYALRCWGHHNDHIEGVESVATGRRFTITAWRKRNGVDRFGSPLLERKHYLESDLQSTKRRVGEIEREIAKLEEEYTDWSKEPTDG